MNHLTNTETVKRIAVVAGDNKITELIEWSYFNKHLLQQHQLTAISETADILEGTMNIPVEKLFTRNTGGYQQLASLIEKGKIDILFFFAEPALAKEKDTDMKKVLVAAANQNIVVACNKQMTGIVMNSVLQKKETAARLRSHPGLLKQTISFFSQLNLKQSVAAM
jgi:methylglyoxal synthase